MGLTITVTAYAPPTAYCARSDVEDMFGVANVAKWADLDNDADEGKIAARVAKAVEFARGEVDARLMGGEYTVPLVGEDTTLTDAAARLAGVWLYENRGVEDYDPDTGRAVHRLSWHRDRAEAFLREVQAGTRRLACERQDDATPAAVEDEDE